MLDEGTTVANINKQDFIYIYNYSDSLVSPFLSRPEFLFRLFEVARNMPPGVVFQWLIVPKIHILLFGVVVVFLNFFMYFRNCL